MTEKYRKTGNERTSEQEEKGAKWEEKSSQKAAVRERTDK